MAHSSYILNGTCLAYTCIEKFSHPHLLHMSERMDTTQTYGVSVTCVHADDLE